jgi:hypothetical protein
MKSKIAPPFSFIFLEWLDATRGNDWMNAEAVEELVKDDSTGLIREGGWLLKETEHYLVIAANIGDSLSEHGNDQFNGVSRIPKTWIRRRIALLTLHADGSVTTHRQPRTRLKGRTKTVT